MEPIVNPNRFYVYVLCRPDGQPFYVGKGHGDRHTHHRKDAHKGRQNRVCKVIRKLWREGREYHEHILWSELTHKDACAIERFTIATIGRQPLGPLVNLKPGGDDSVPLGGHSASSRSLMSEAAKQRIPWNKGRHLSIDQKAKLSSARKAWFADERHRDEFRQRMKMRKSSKQSNEEKRRQGYVSPLTGKPLSNTHREAIAVGQTRRWAREHAERSSKEHMEVQVDE